MFPVSTFESPVCLACRLAIILGLCLFSPAVALFGQEAVDSMDSTRPVSEQEPHPWIATAPPGFSRAIALGNVRIAVDDPRLERANKQGLTVFQIRVDYRYRYVLQSTVRDPEDATLSTATFTARLTLREVECEHTILLQSLFRPSDPWSTPLLQHEFDHVSISTDPRLFRMARRLLSQPVRGQLRWPNRTELDPKKLDEAIKEEVSARIAELERIVQANYDWLDRETGNGTANLSKRTRFFQELYAKDWLRQCEFRYLDMLRSETDDGLDKEVSDHYLLLERP